MYLRVEVRVNPETRSAWLPYVVPFATFLALTFAGSQWPSAAHLWYAAKTVIVAVMLIAWRRSYPELRWSRSIANWAIGFAAGLLVLVVWVAPEKLLEPLKLGEPGGFDPHAFGASGAGLWAIAGVRLLGASLVVPVMEELFWRSFLMRALIRSDFREVALGTFRLFSFALVAILFGLEHFRWVVGILAGLAYGGLLVWRRDLFTCVLAHAVTNLGLGLYVLATGRWDFW
ncbi:MAG: CAAX prenyl protease-related protein [Candidatus Eisenbacteria bacterium]|nr:CAAX prenyl protease-related protein [Candidatus Eisenbacteria bacterium]